MITPTKQRIMREYLTDKLRGAYTVEPRSLDVSGFNAHYILLDQTQPILLVDRRFPATAIEQAHLELLKIHPSTNVGFVVYKDGNTFFKSNAEWGYKQFKKGKLHINEHNIREIMSLSPEEIFVQHMMSGRIQYYQPTPDSVRSTLEQGLVQYTVRPVSIRQGGESINLKFNPKLFREIAGRRPKDYVLSKEHEFDEELQKFGSYLVPKM